MTVQGLIDELLKVEDKSLAVVVMGLSDYDIIELFEITKVNKSESDYHSYEGNFKYSIKSGNTIVLF